tara:strand:- start:378 stop:617 length:240 start_codon:yes stop_codon:yes gene_type:complete
MFEKRIAKSMLRFVGVEQPTKMDIARFITKFKVDKLRTGKKIMVGMGLPMILSLFEYRMFGVYEDEPTREEERKHKGLI